MKNFRKILTTIIHVVKKDLEFDIKLKAYFGMAIGNQSNF